MNWEEMLSDEETAVCTAIRIVNYFGVYGEGKSFQQCNLYIMYLIVLMILSLETHKWSDHVFGKHDLSFQLLHQRTRFPWKSDATTCVMGRFSSQAKSIGSCNTSDGEFNPRLYRPPHHHSHGSIEKAKSWTEHIQGEREKRGTWIGNGWSITCFD